MKNALRVLGRDLARLLKTPAALVVAIVLIVLPSLYTWFNVIGFWDPYNNTGGMRVCVVNEDEGGTNDLMGTMNLGDQIVDQLHENTQLQWDFMDYDAAMDEINAGTAYAAFVIPKDFTSDLMTILTEDFQQPNIQYYVNEKMNPVSPKVTDAGSTTLDETINSTFVSTVSSTVASVMNQKLDEAGNDVDAAQSDVSAQLGKARDSVSSTRTTISDLASEANGAQDKTNSAKDQLQQAYTDAESIENQLQQVADLTVTMQNSIGNFTSVALPAFSNANTGLSSAANEASTSVSSVSSTVVKAQGSVDSAIARGQSVVDMNNAVIQELQTLVSKIPDDTDSDSGSDSGGSGTGSGDSGDTGGGTDSGGDNTGDNNGDSANSSDGGNGDGGASNDSGSGGSGASSDMGGSGDTGGKGDGGSGAGGSDDNNNTADSGQGDGGSARSDNAGDNNTNSTEDANSSTSAAGGSGSGDASNSGSSNSNSNNANSASNTDSAASADSSTSSSTTDTDSSTNSSSSSNTNFNPSTSAAIANTALDALDPATAFDNTPKVSDVEPSAQETATGAVEDAASATVSTRSDTKLAASAGTGVDPNVKTLITQGLQTKSKSIVSKAASIKENVSGIQVSLTGKQTRASGIKSAVKSRLQEVVDRLQNTNDDAQRDLDDLSKLSSDITTSANSVTNAANTLNTAVQSSLTNANNYQSQLFGTSLPAVSQGLSGVGSSALSLKAAVSNQTALIGQTSNVLDQLNTTLATAASALGQTDTLLASLDSTLETAQIDVGTLGTSTAISELLSSGSIDAEKLADFMQSPTQVTTEKLYPLNAYGSAMAPLFISLSLWVGCVMLCVIMKLEIDNEKIPELTVSQGWLGRWLLFAIMAALQAVVCVAGCLYIGVQCESVPAFYLTAITMSLAYLCIVYTLSSSLQHIGIGLCIILVFVQIPGGTGLYPIEMTPDFFQAVYPLFPFTYGINALRETIAGFYQNQYAQYMGMLFLIGAIMFVAGLFGRPQLTNFNRLVSREVAESDLLNNEEALVPERKYRMRQLLRALSDHQEFHEDIREGEERFMRYYPRLLRGALVAGIVVPVIATTVLVLTEGEKVIILTLWLFWLVAIIAFLIIVEYIRASVGRRAAIDAMSDDELYEQLSARRTATRNKPVAAMGVSAASQAKSDNAGLREDAPDVGEGEAQTASEAGESDAAGESHTTGEPDATDEPDAASESGVTGKDGETTRADEAGETDKAEEADEASKAEEASEAEEADDASDAGGAGEVSSVDGVSNASEVSGASEASDTDAHGDPNKPDKAREEASHA